nr:molybdopterin-binding protein [Leucobacter exalbidus]
MVTGAELQPLGAQLSRGQIPESNSLLMRGLLAECGITRVHVARCPDDEATVRAQLAKLGATHDLVVTTGGVGPGTRDVMRIVLADEPEVRAVRVAVRPGQPQCTGRLTAGAWIFALPGNPVSAAVSFELFVRPALRTMQGCADTSRPRLRATAAASWRGATGRLQVLPVIFTQDPEPSIAPAASELRCLPAVHAGRVSHSVGGHGAAEGYALVGPETGDVHEGDQVTVIRVVA